ncbi:hypothetical protein [Salinibacter altiplanensis]|uniref:hypothetical protein n=1 Tax=Salinibacter altiplanensis TaxID=1803181 RepID=UPI000C9F2A6B|nr:hypothetical protein [Salinibacter altiplanensis]
MPDSISRVVQANSSSRPFGDRSCGPLLLVLLVSTLLALPLPGVAQTTQTLSLESGWNTVSLYVQPSDSSFTTLFGGTPVSIAKNEDGEVYLPEEGIEQITTWQADEGYQVYTETATTLDVTGPEASPGAAIELKEGWNLVPYLSGQAQAVEPALVSIEEALVVAEDGDGAQYDPSASSSPLDSLRPGQGYKVHVDRADTLRYPVVAETLDGALALTGVPVGRHVHVRGHSEPGDGGGGLFRVTASGAATDGGTVFVFDEDSSTQKPVTVDVSKTVQGTSLPDSDLIWGSVEVEAPGWPETADEKYLHGHAASRNGMEDIKTIDYKSGSIGGGRFFQGEMVRYKYATSDRRLERMGVTNAVNIDWWGAVKADPNNPVNNWWRVATALNVAAKIRKNTSNEWTYVDIPGEYYFRNTIRIRQGTKLRGASNLYDRKATKTYGQSNGQPTYGKLTMMPGRALYHLKQAYVNNQNDRMTYLMGVEARNIVGEYNASRIGMKSLELDGNIDNNTEPFEDPKNEYVDKGLVQKKLQQSVTWGGLAGAVNIGWGQDTIEGGNAEFNDVYIHDFPAGAINTGNAYDFTESSNLRLANGSRNHTLYRTAGSLKDILVEGGGWAVTTKLTRGSYTNITHNLSPTRDVVHDNWGTTWKEVYSHHGKDFGLDWVEDSNRISNMKLNLTEWSVNLPSESRANISVIKAKSFGGIFKNGSVTTTSSKTTTVLRPFGTRIRNYTLDGLDVAARGGDLMLVSSQAGFADVVFKNATVTAESGAGSNNEPIIDIDMSGPDTYDEDTASGEEFPWGKAGRLDFENIDFQYKHDKFLFGVGGNSVDDLPFDLFTSSLKVDNTANLLMDRERGKKAEIRAVFRAYMSNSTFRIPTTGAGDGDKLTHEWLLDDEKTVRLRNVTSQRGRVSDGSGTYTSDAGDEGNDFVLIPTGLMSLAQERSATVTSGNSSVTSVDNADSNGNVLTWDPDNPEAFDPRDPYLKVNLVQSIGNGETIDVDWTAKVTPTEDYQTTGLFIARPVGNKIYTSGDGPFTVDLRGVAATQETQDAIRYSVSSDDTSVVTATVNSYEDPFGNVIPWELELTEQGTGTATVTVTGSIDGVGSTTDTFEVSIE